MGNSKAIPSRLFVDSVFYGKFVMNFDCGPVACSAVTSHVSRSASSLKEGKKGCSMDRVLLVRTRLARLVLLLLLLLFPQAWKPCLCSCRRVAMALRHPINDGGSEARADGQPEAMDDEGGEADRRSLLGFMQDGSDRW